jgi:hypothetical protein
MKILISAALSFVILLTHPSLGGAQKPSAQNEAQRIKSLSRILDSGSYQEKNKAIFELSWPKSEEAGNILLKRLKHNLAKNKGAQPYPWSSTSGEMILWGYSPSENELLTGALARQGYLKAIPILIRMLKMKPERSGISMYNLAYHLHQMTAQPVKYEENGEMKIYPEQPVKP